MEFPITAQEIGGGSDRIRTVDELRQFLEAQRSAWAWLPDVLSRIGNQRGNINAHQDAWNRLAAATQNARSELDQGNLDQAVSTWTNYLQSPSPLPGPSSLQGRLVADVRGQIGDRAAVGALGVLLPGRCDGDDPEQVRGVFAAHEFLLGTGKTARQSVQNALQSLLSRLGEQQTRAEDKADLLDKLVERIEQRRRRQFKRLLADGDKARKLFAARTEVELERIRSEEETSRNAIQSTADAAVNSIKETEKVYSEHMGLQGPVTYWTNKAKAHRKKGWAAAVIGLVYAVIIISYVLGRGTTDVLTLVKATVKETGQWQLAYVVLTINVFLLTIAFWIGRLISRTFVSQSHLTLDAEERATMVQTYLALTKENKITDAERVLVLGALFRGSEDGLVKDDGSPDTNIVSLLSKVGASPSPAAGH